MVFALFISLHSLCFSYEEQLTLITCNQTSALQHTIHNTQVQYENTVPLPASLLLMCHKPRPAKGKICLRWSSSGFGALKRHVNVKHDLLVSVGLHQSWWSIFIQPAQPVRLHRCCRVAVKYCSYPQTFQIRLFATSTVWECEWVSSRHTHAHTHIQAPYPCVLSALLCSILPRLKVFVNEQRQFS